MNTKEDVEAFITKTIEDGHEVCIYRGEDLRAGEWPTTGVTPVYIGRLTRSAIYELNGGAEKKPLTYGRIIIERSDTSVVSGDDVVDFDFR